MENASVDAKRVAPSLLLTRKAKVSGAWTTTSARGYSVGYFINSVT